MQPPEASTDAGTGSAALEFARCWADFTKALSIYPATNMRVRTTLAGMLEAHCRALNEREGSDAHGVTVVFRNGELELNGVEQEVDAPGNLHWLRDRLDRAALAGVDFLPELREESLVEFTKQLLRAYLESGAHPSFEQLWPRPFAGMALVDRRFEGGFGSGPRSHGTSAAGSESDGGTRAPEAASRARSGRRGRGELAGQDLVDVLMADGDVMVRLTRIRTLADQRAAADERGTVSQLLDRIVVNMPAESLKDRKTFFAAVHEVLEALELETESERTDARSAMADEGTLKALLHSVSHSYFKRSGPDKTAWARDPDMEEDDDGLRLHQGHVGDNEITDDVGQLLQEIEALPKARQLLLSRDDVELRSEEIAVCMHYLSNMDEGTLPASLHRTLRRLLATPGRQELDTLRTCVLADAERRGVASGQATLTPIQSFLRSTNNGALLRACNLFTPEWVAAVFPRYFVPYLESIDPMAAREMALLDSVCESVGPKRMIDAVRETQFEARLLDTKVITRLLREPTPARLPLAHLCLSWFGQPVAPQVATYLRTLDPSAPEAFLLYQFSDLGDLTAEYLFAMIELEVWKVDPRRLRDAVAGALCRHIRRLGESDPASTSRVESIRSLARFPSPTARKMLRELTRGSWRPFGDREPGVIRRVARTVSKTCRKAA